MKLLSVRPTMFRLYTQSWQRQVLSHEEIDIVLHTFESRALFDSARQYADSDCLHQIAQWLIDDNQPQVRTLKFRVLYIDT